MVVLVLVLVLVSNADTTCTIVQLNLGGSETEQASKQATLPPPALLLARYAGLVSSLLGGDERGEGWRGVEWMVG